MLYNDAIKLLDEILAPLGFTRRRETFAKQIKEGWSCIVAVLGNDYFMQASFGLVNDKLSSLIQRSLTGVDGVISAEIQSNPIPAYQVAANGISAAANTLRALETRTRQVEVIDIQQLALFISNEAICHLESMANIERIANILSTQDDALSGHLGMFLIPATLLLADRKGDAEEKMRIAKNIIGGNQRMAKMYDAYCTSLLARLSHRN